MQTKLLFDIEKRTDYTFKYNIHFGRHGWLRLTPAYSVKLVNEILKTDCKEGDIILDPFSGTATTGLVASELGFSSILFEINPFLIWLGNIKCSNYTIKDLDFLEQKFDQCIKKIMTSDKYWTPPIHNITRWWQPETLHILASIRDRIVDMFGEPRGNHYHNLIWIAFSRLIIETSSAAFNHVSMSFKENTTQYGFSQIKFLLQTILFNIIDTAKSKLTGNAKVIHANSVNLPFDKTAFCNVVITSPPYPNRISYVRELRPYMYWTKFLTNGSDAGSLDWEAIGGTWGTATSNLKNWMPVNKNLPHQIYEVCEKINNSNDKNATLMSQYVHKYFDDIYSHLSKLSKLLKPDAKLNYIVGNSSFYGHFVHTQEIIAEIMKHNGYKKIKINTIRRRNTKKGLLEYLIKATWN